MRIGLRPTSSHREHSNDDSNDAKKAQLGDERALLNAAGRLVSISQGSRSFTQYLEDGCKDIGMLQAEAVKSFVRGVADKAIQLKLWNKLEDTGFTGPNLEKELGQLVRRLQKQPRGQK